MTPTTPTWPIYREGMGEGRDKACGRRHRAVSLRREQRWVQGPAGRRGAVRPPEQPDSEHAAGDDHREHETGGHRADAILDRPINLRGRLLRTEPGFRCEVREPRH